MRRVMIGNLGAIVKLGVRELIQADSDCEIVGEPAELDQLLQALELQDADVVVLDLDDRHAWRDLTAKIVMTHPEVLVIACSSAEPRMRVFPPFKYGESYVARMSPEVLIETVKNN